MLFLNDNVWNLKLELVASALVKYARDMDNIHSKFDLQTLNFKQGSLLSN